MSGVFAAIPQPFLLSIGVLSTFSTLTFGWIGYKILFRRDPKFPVDDVKKMVDESDVVKHAKGNKSTELLTAVITGSTAGIGLNVATELYRLGLRVIIASRSEERCKQAIEEIKSTVPDSKGVLEYHKLDVGDLDSVVQFAKWFNSKYESLTYLVNNAGIHYAMDGPANLFETKASLSPQGYDEVFATNYLGHFLLTELLLPKIKYGRVVSLSSSYHYSSEGDGLFSDDDKLPNAADGTIQDFSHRYHAYSVTKLAQILHMVELQRRLSKKSDNTVKAISICPGWVKTKMIPSGVIGKLLFYLAFNQQAGVLSALFALFDASLQGGEFVGNAVVPFSQYSWFGNVLDVLTWLGIRYYVLDVWALVFAFTQVDTYGKNILISSKESRDAKRGARFYDWTIEQLKGKGYL